MARAKKALTWTVALLFALFVGIWTYYVATSLRHVYVLLDCSKGQVSMIPQFLCRNYLFRFGLAADDVAQINHDGSLFHVVSTADQMDQVQLLEFLLKHGVAINGLDGRVGITALHGAALDNNVEVAELLLQHGADRLIRDRKHGLTPFEFAQRAGEKSDRPDRTAMMRLLQQEGARIP